ncbi:MAG: penicillin-binding protein 2 [Patescibacteria group bacterium]
MNFRLSIILIGIALIYSSLVFNIYRLQIEKGDYYSAKAETQYGSAGLLKAKRGIIYFSDKNGNSIPAAINKKYPLIFAVPSEIQNIDESAKKISEALKLDLEKLITQFSKDGDLYELLIAKATPEEVAAVSELNLPGIYVNREELRSYPFGDLAAHLLGFVSLADNDDRLRGRYGAELYFEDLLAGKDGKLEEEKIVEPVDGNDLKLTLDRNIQAQAESVLRGVIEKYKAAGGTVIVQDPKTGRILALGNYPVFDPNDYSNSPIKNYLNPAVQLIYEPGSVFKVITMAIGIDSGKITPETTYYDSGSITLNGRTIKNWDFDEHGAYGKVTMTNVIERSINTGAVFAQRQIGPDIFYNYLLQFGFQDKTEINLPGEVSGRLTNLKTSFREINFATAAFGQGVSVTPIRLISAISAIANQGILMKPLITDEETSQRIREVIKPDTAKQVTDMMVSAVQKAGVAQIPQYKIAGKTGTAQIPDLKNGGYLEAYIHSFVGFAPASDPKFTILIKVDRPQAPLAGATVVPAFKELAEFILNYYNIPPDNLQN